MKAGIYQCYDGTLLYIAKDRTIKAFTSHVIHDEWTGEALSERADLITVTTANREQLARFTHNGRTVEAKRLDNVPNGCTDHLRALSKVSYSMLLGPIADHTRVRNQGEHLLDYIYAVCGLVCVLDALIGTPKKCLLKAECSMCAQSVCDECGPPVSVTVKPFSDTGRAALKTSMTGGVSPMPVVESEMDRVMGHLATPIGPLARETAAQEAFSRDRLLSGEAAALGTKKDGGFTAGKNLLFTSGSADFLALEAQDRRFLVVFNETVTGRYTPNDERDPYLAFAQESLAEPLVAKQAEDHPRRRQGRSAALGMPYGRTPEEKVRRLGDSAATSAAAFEAYNIADLKQQLRGLGFKFCHKGSAKKHRKQGDEVVRADANGLYAWRPR